MTALIRLLAPLAAAALPGCWLYEESHPTPELPPLPDAAAPGPDGSPGGDGGDAGDAGDGAPRPPTCAERRAAYPAGPFGTSEGDAIANLAFTTPTGEAVDLQSLRADCTYNLAVITTSAGWCTACREEQPRLQGFFDDYKDHGVVVVVTLFEDDNYAPADADLARGWQRRYDLTFPVWADSDFVLGDYYDRDQTPMVMLLDLETMRIGEVMNGFVESDVRTLVNSML